MTTLTVDSWALHELTLDFADQFVSDTLIANANDAKGRGIDLHVTQDGQPLSMSGMTVYLAWRHDKGSQGLTAFSAVDSSEGHWKVYYPAGMMVGGDVLARIAIYLGTKTPITGSRDFTIHVEENPIDEGKAMASDDFSLFKQATIDLNTYRAEVEAEEQSRQRAESQRVANENQRLANERSRQSAESTRATNENARKSAESSRATAETNRSSAESKRASEESARATAETNRASAEAGRVKAEKGRVTAENGRVSAEDERVKKCDEMCDRAEKATASANQSAQAANDAATAARLAAAEVSGKPTQSPDVEKFQHQVSTLGSMVADLKGDYYVLEGTIYAPRQKASVSGLKATVSSTSTVTGSKANLK